MARTFFGDRCIVAFGETLAEAAGDVFRSLGSPRRRAADLAIGVTAAARGAVLLSRNAADFEGVPELRVETATAPRDTFTWNGRTAPRRPPATTAAAQKVRSKGAVATVMTAFTESVVEKAALAWLEGLGWSVVPGPRIAYGEPGAERTDPAFRDVVLEGRLRAALARLNPDLPPEALEDALRKLTRTEAPSLLERNRALHRMLVDGVTVEYRRPDGSIAGDQARVIGFDSPAENDWLAVNQFTSRPRCSRRGGRREGGAAPGIEARHRSEYRVGHGVISTAAPRLGRITPRMGANAPIVPGSLADALFTSTEQRVLALLFGQPDRSFQKSEIVRLAQSGTGAVYRLLDRLAERGLVTVRAVGNQRHYRANREAPIFSELHGLVVKTVALVEPLRAALEPLPGIVAAFVYGSIAKGTDMAESDVDLLVVSDDHHYADLLEALQSVEPILGRPVHPTLLRPGEWREKLAVEHSFVVRIASQPRIFILGSDDVLR